MYAKRIKEITFSIDSIIPIPLHKSKLPKRGYNQATQFAMGLSKGLTIPLDEKSLVRDVLSISETQKSRTERYENTKGVFSIRSKESIENKHILLVNDVLTTGATICEAGQLLVDHGAKISIATIARA